MATNHKLIIGNCMDMGEIPDGSVHLAVTSPPYFNAPFDYKNLFKNYDQFLGVLRKVARESFRVLAEGRIFVLNIDDMLVNGDKFPIVEEAELFYKIHTRCIFTRIICLRVLLYFKKGSLIINLFQKMLGKNQK